MEPKSLEIKTLDQLRALARTAGIRGYTGLRKKQLIELLVKPKASTSKRPAAEKKPKTKTGRPKTAKTRETPSVRKSGKKDDRIAISANDIEERIESAKFQVISPLQKETTRRPDFSPSLNEDIENMPSLGESVLCLLPQKPGVVHAYWTLQPGASRKPLRLRLCHMSRDAIDVFEEVDIRGYQGHWYFQVPEDAELGTVFGHLGYYDNEGQFVTAIERGVARIPTLYASERTDRSWWINDADFRAMYKRAGGIVRGRNLRWRGSSSQSSRHK